MKGRITIGLQVFPGTDSSISHDGRSAAGFERVARLRPLPQLAGSAVKTVLGIKLMPDFVRDIIDVKRIVGYNILTRCPFRLDRVVTGCPQEGGTANTGTENMADIVGPSW